MAATKKTSKARIDDDGVQEAWNTYKELAADYARKAQHWRDAKELQEVRMDDLVKVHEHVPLDEDAVARVAAATAAAIQAEDEALTSKQASKKALDSAWKTVQDFEEHDDVQPLIPDDE